MSSKAAKKRLDAPRTLAQGDADSDPDLRLEAFLPYRLAVLADRVSRAIARRYQREFDLTIPEWRVMALLGVRPGLTAREVAEQTPMDKVAISRAVRRLTDAGRLRAAPDPEDARRQRLVLTARGQSIYRKIAPLALRLEAQLLANMSEGDRAHLSSLIDRLDQAARDLELALP